MQNRRKMLKTLKWLLTLLSVVCLAAGGAHAQNNFKLFLVGDAGDDKEPGETLIQLRKELLKNPNSAVVFLGDNSYRYILPGVINFGYKGFDSSANTIDKVSSQLALLDDYHGYAYFVPGNHDWWNRPTYESGRPKLAMEESFIEQNLRLNKTIANPGPVFLPSHGSYGPDVAELNNGRLRLVFIDTYRVIVTGVRKNKIPPEEELFYLKLDSVIHAGYLLNQKVVVVAHNPVFSIGPNNRVLKNPMFLRRIKSSMTDFPSYKKMSVRITGILKKYPGIYYASGHLHALQYFYTSDSIHYIISGAGSKEKMLSEKEKQRYSTDALKHAYILWNSGGFFALECSEQQCSTTLYYDEASAKCIVE